MLYVVLLRYRAALAEVDQHLPAHRAYLCDHYARGHFLLSGPQEPRTGGIILANAESREEVVDWIKEDPFHRYGIAQFEIIAWSPTLRHPDVATYFMSVSAAASSVSKGDKAWQRE